MKTSRRFAILSSVASLFAAVTLAQNAGYAPQVQQQQAVPAPAQVPQGQPQSACGNQPLCTDTPDFTATVTDFRQTNTNGIKVLDVTIRFQNKTSDTLILGYADGSEMAIDDQGNRYAPNPWGNAYRGIGAVNGNNMDPKFVMRPGSWGDARFELVWRPGAQDPIGNAFEYALSIREINTLPGNQHTLGGEFPIHFQGLVNGAGGAAPAYSGAPVATAAGNGAAGYVAAAGGTPTVANGPNGAPCGPNGTMTAVNNAANGSGNQTATNAASQANNAASTLSSLGAIFKRKNTAANGAAPCSPAAPAAVPVAGTATVPATATGSAKAPGTATTPVQTNAVMKTGATSPATAAQPTPAVARTNSRAVTPVATNAKAPVAATAKAPATAAAPAAAAPAPAAKPAAAPAAKPAAAPAAKPAPAPAKKPAPADAPK